MNAPVKTSSLKGPKTDPQVVTFGCRLNAYESEVLRGHARAAGLEQTVILNSCAVTAEAERQLRQAIRKARRENPQAQIIVTGCAAQIDPQRYAAMAEVDRVIGNEEKLNPATWGLAAPPRVMVNDIMTVKETAPHLIQGFEGKTRAFIEVQQGCDHRCTFCIIPFGRGNSRSVPMGEIATQVRLLVEKGVKEVVLTGVDVTSYGHDLPGTPSLGQMIRRLLAAVPELPRLRLSSLDPVEIDEDLWRLIAGEARLMPHLHLSIQAGDDLILKRMKRRHLRADVLALASRARALRPDMVFGADIIAGFPTETEEMFTNSLRLVEEAGLTFLHVFPYSARDGTPAARMPQVDKALRKARAARLRTAGEAQLQRFLESRVGKAEEILIEKAGSNGANLGRSAHYAEVQAVGKIGEIVTTRIIGLKGKMLIGDRT